MEITFLKTRIASCLQKRLPLLQHKRATDLLAKCGDRFALHIFLLLVHAAKQEKTDVVLDLIETHYREVLIFQSPEAHCAISRNLMCINPTDLFLLETYHDVLGLELWEE